MGGATMTSDLAGSRIYSGARMPSDSVGSRITLGATMTSDLAGSRILSGARMPTDSAGSRTTFGASMPSATVTTATLPKVIATPCPGRTVLTTGPTVQIPYTAQIPAAVSIVQHST